MQNIENNRVNPLIPELKEQLKRMIIDFIKKYKYDVVYTYKIVVEEEYSVYKASLYDVYKVVNKLGEFKYYLYNIMGRFEIIPLSENVNELVNGSVLTWEHLSKLFKLFKWEQSNAIDKHYYRDREFFDIYPPLEDEVFLESTLNKVFYELYGNSIVNNLVEIREVIGCELHYFEFTGLEKMEDIPIKIRVDLNSNPQKEYSLSFDVAPEYVNSFLPNIEKNRRFYKDEGYYKDKKSISATLASKFLTITDREFLLDGDGIPDEFVEELSDFIHNDNIFVMQIDTEFNSDNSKNKDAIAIAYHCFKGLKIYKIPQAPFNWEPVLVRIKDKLIKLKTKGNLVFGDIENLMKCYKSFSIYNMSFECSPDNYLEIYGTKEALELFFLPGGKDDFESFDAVYPLASFKLINVLDHYEDQYSPLFEITVYKHQFGSQNNSFFYNKFSFEYD